MRLFKNLKARILKSIITWSEMGKQTAQAKEVYYAIRLPYMCRCFLQISGCSQKLEIFRSEDDHKEN